MSVLDEILKQKREEVIAAKRRVPASDLEARANSVAEPTRAFADRLASARPPAVIAEVKHRSPSKGVIRPGFDAVGCARAYERGGAAALSVLTDEEFFGGHLDYLAAIRAAVGLPLLRKDFIIDPYQIDEARVAGADAILLIVSALDQAQLKDLHAHAMDRQLDVLVETHDSAEFDVALDLGARMIGVNNRDLRTFEVDLAVTERLAARIPAERRFGLSGSADEVLLVAESGIRNSADIARLEEAGAAAYLVGESLMREPDPGYALEQLRRPL